MQRTGRRLGDAIRQGRLGPAVIFLRGGLGAGKTTLAKGLLAGLGVTEPVTSPTFTLVEQYDIGGSRFFHFDLYRLTSPEDLEMLGIRDMIGADNLCLFEWPERGHGMLPVPDLDIDIRFVPEKTSNNQDPAQRIADQECRMVKVSPAVLSHFFLDQETAD